MKNILVLCTGNSCRSQMAQGYLNRMMGSTVRVFSAGLEAHGLNPNAVKVMAEDGVTIAHHTSNILDEYLDIPFDVIITVCDHASENCPIFPGNAKRLHHNFTDPAKAKGTESEILDAFRSTRDEIRQWCADFSKAYVA